MSVSGVVASVEPTWTQGQDTHKHTHTHTVKPTHWRGTATGAPVGAACMGPCVLALSVYWNVSTWLRQLWALPLLPTFLSHLFKSDLQKEKEKNLLTSVTCLLLGLCSQEGGCAENAWISVHRSDWWGGNLSLRMWGEAALHACLILPAGQLGTLLISQEKALLLCWAEGLQGLRCVSPLTEKATTAAEKETLQTPDWCV